MSVRRLFFPDPMPRSTGGFSLIELIAVMVLLGIISFAVFPRYASTDAAAVQSARDQLLAAAATARQIAMARGGSDNPVALTVGANSINVTEDGNPVAGSGIEYPFSLPDGVSVTAGTGSYDFDKLGRTSGGQITLSRGGASADVQLEASGYAYTP